MSLDPMITELMDFAFSQVHRGCSASEVSDGDLNAAILEGTDFGCGNKRASRRVHSVERH